MLRVLREREQTNLFSHDDFYKVVPKPWTLFGLNPVALCAPLRLGAPVRPSIST